MKIFVNNLALNITDTDPNLKPPRVILYYKIEKLEEILDIYKLATSGDIKELKEIFLHVKNEAEAADFLKKNNLK